MKTQCTLCVSSGPVNQDSQPSTLRRNYLNRKTNRQERDELQPEVLGLRL